MAGAAYPTRPAGPCTPWCDRQDVLGLVTLADEVDLNAAIEAASWLLWSLSGRQFSGGCIETVRPCRVGCGCWGPGGPGGSPGANGVNLALAGADWWFGGYGGGGVPGWTNDCGDSCGCGTLSSVTLDGYPVTAIQQVLIDGQVVDPATYRLDGNRYLVRLVDPDSGDQLHWPACQNMARDSLIDAGTWEVTYEYGSPPPALGVMAAAELAVQFYYASTGNAACKLPSGVTKIVRQGITIERLVPMFVKGQRTGLVLPDAFLAGVNPNGLRRRPAVMSPGVPRYPRRTTT